MARKNKKLNFRNTIETNEKKAVTCNKIQLENSTRSPKELYLKNKFRIYCNAAETEPNYFNKLKEEVDRDKIIDLEVKILTKPGIDPLSLVNYAIKEKDKKSLKIQESWVVFDKDDYNIEPAISKAIKHGIEVAWSNECFELWFLLHFSPLTSSINRADCLKRVEKLFMDNFRKPYFKNSVDSYKLLKPSQKKALSNSKKLFQENKRDGKKPNNSNPCTTVDQLINTLISKIKPTI